MKIWYLTYAFNSRGNTQFYKNFQKISCYYAENSGCENILELSIDDIDIDFKKTYKHIMEDPSDTRGAAYFLWKPYIIFNTLRKIDNDDILIYCDVDWSLINYKLNIEFLKDILSIQPIHGYKLGEIGSKLNDKAYTKRELLNFMDVENNDNILLTGQLQAGRLLLCKNSIDFIEEWLKISCTSDLITDNNDPIIQYPEFIAHRHDQSILSILYKKIGFNKSYLIPNMFTEIREFFK